MAAGAVTTYGAIAFLNQYGLQASQSLVAWVQSVGYAKASALLATVTTGVNHVGSQLNNLGTAGAGVLLRGESIIRNTYGAIQGYYYVNAPTINRIAGSVGAKVSNSPLGTWPTHDKVDKFLLFFKF